MKKNSLTPTAKKVLQQERKNLIKAQKSSRERRESQARGSLSMRKSLKADATRPAIDSLIQVATANAAAVASTWRVHLPIKIVGEHGSTQLSAWTDYKTIHVKLPVSKFVDSAGRIAPDRVRTLIAHLKAAAYHEVGHIRFTLPFTQLWEQYSPNDPSTPTTHRWWNVLEDQRMEARVVAESPNVGNYLTALISDEFPTTDALWAWVAGRDYLPEALRIEARRLCAASFGEQVAVDVNRIIRNYSAATDYPSMVVLVKEFATLMDSLQVQPQYSNTTHNERRDNEPSAADGATGQSVSAAEQGDEGDGDRDGETAGSDEADGDGGEADGEGDDEDAGAGASGSGADEAGEPKGAGSTGSSSGGSGVGSGVNKAIEEAVRQAQEALDKDPSLTEAVRDVQSGAGVNADGTMSRLPSIVTLRSDLVSRAEAVASDMERAFDVRTADCAPIWQARSTRGVIDPFAYRTREPGSRDFRRHFDDRGDLGRSVAVSVLLDTSGSMGGNEDDLSTAGLAIARGCRDSGIPCTVTSFSYRSHLVYDPSDAELVPVWLCASGGTNPEHALESCSDQRHGKDSHIVIILTDGVWDTSGYEALRAASAESEVFVLGYGMDTSHMRAFSGAGAKEARNIDDLWELPHLVQSMVEDYLG